MKFDVRVIGSIRNDFKREMDKTARVMTGAVREAVDGAKQEMRRQVAAAGYERRMQNTWRGEVYPKRPIVSIEAAGMIFTKAAKIFEGLERGGVIRAKNSRFLAIPTENAPKRINRKRPTPELWERRYGEKLVFIPTRNGRGLLVARNRRASYSRKTGELRGFRKASARSLRTGAGLTSVVIFKLVPVVRLQKRLSLYDTGDKWQRKMPDLINKQWRREDASEGR